MVDAFKKASRGRPPANLGSQSLYVRIPASVKVDIKRIADARGRTMGSVVRMLIVRSIAQFKP
jgi:hypothetical protein